MHNARLMRPAHACILPGSGNQTVATSGSITHMIHHTMQMGVYHCMYVDVKPLLACTQCFFVFKGGGSCFVPLLERPARGRPTTRLQNRSWPTTITCETVPPKQNTAGTLCRTHAVRLTVGLTVGLTVRQAACSSLQWPHNVCTQRSPPPNHDPTPITPLHTHGPWPTCTTCTSCRCD